MHLRYRRYPSCLLLAVLAAGLLAGIPNQSEAKKAPRASAPRDTADERMRADKVINRAPEVTSQMVVVGAGWALGSTTNAFNPANDDPDNDKVSAEPLVSLTTIIGHESKATLEMKLVLGNFGRLINNTSTQTAIFGPDTSGTAVRRAFIAEMTLRTPPLIADNDFTLSWAIFNTGFIFDAEHDPVDKTPIDAASYLFTGPTVVGMVGEQSWVQADIFLGTSEILTGVGAFDIGLNPPLRFRPRLNIHLGFKPFDEKNIDIGFWGDLGWNSRDADAYTAYVSIPILASKRF